MENVTDPNAANVLGDMRAQLGGGGATATLGFSASTFYCGEIVKDPKTGAWGHDPARLRALLDLSQSLSMPVVVHINGGHWCGGGINDPQSAFNKELGVWRDDQIAWSTDGTSAPAPYKVTTGPDTFYASYSLLFDENDPKTYRYWKKKILSTAIAEIVQYFEEPGKKPLLAGVSLDSETRYTGASPWTDYNPTFVEEWRQYMQGTGAYAPGGRYPGRSPALSMADFNAAFGTSYASFADVAPPRAPAQTPLWHEWTRFRVEAVRHFTQDMRGWIVGAGLPADLVFNHQVPEVDWQGAADDLYAAQLTGSGAGVTTYGTPAIDPNLFARVRGYGARWGIFEHNPLDCGDFAQDQARDTGALFALKAAGADVVCPYAWPVDPNFKPCAKYPGIAIEGTPYAKALSALLLDATPRPPRVDPSAPGTTAIDLFATFAQATSASSPDTHAAPGAKVGGVAMDAIFEHPPGPGGTATLTFAQRALPATSGRLLFVAWLGFVDTAGFGGDGALARLRVAGQPVFEDFVGREDTWWKRWRPIVVDVTGSAGKTVDVVLETEPGGDNTWDHFVWGSPRFVTTP
jgi:hypothetical protein